MGIELDPRCDDCKGIIGIIDRIMLEWKTVGHNTKVMLNSDIIFNHPGIEEELGRWDIHPERPSKYSANCVSNEHTQYGYWCPNREKAVDSCHDVDWIYKGGEWVKEFKFRNAQQYDTTKMRCRPSLGNPNRRWRLKDRRNRALDNIARVVRESCSAALTPLITIAVRRVCDVEITRQRPDLGSEFQQATVLIDEYLYHRKCDAQSGAEAGGKTLSATQNGMTQAFLLARRKIIAFIRISPCVCSSCSVPHNPLEEAYTCPVQCNRSDRCQHFALSEDGMSPLDFGGVPTCYLCACKLPSVTKEQAHAINKRVIKTPQRARSKREDVRLLVLQADKEVERVADELFTKEYTRGFTEKQARRPSYMSFDEFCLQSKMTFAKVVNSFINERRPFVLPPGQDRLGPFLEATDELRSRLYGPQFLYQDEASKLDILCRPLFMMRSAVGRGMRQLAFPFFGPHEFETNSKLIALEQCRRNPGAIATSCYR